MRVVAIGARDPERARDAADRLGVPDAGTTPRCSRNPDVDLVYIPLPSTVQAQWAVRALQAGKHVLCEKPLSANGTTAAQIADAADAAGRRAFVGFHYRLHGFTRRLLEVLASGVLGDVQRVEFDYSIPHFVVKPGNIRLDGDLGGGSFMDVGCYAVDLMRAAWGEPTVVSAEAVLSDARPACRPADGCRARASGRHPGLHPLVVHRRRQGQHVAAGRRGPPRPSRRRASSCRSGAPCCASPRATRC